MNITTGGIHKADNRHYEVPLPLCDENVRLPCNRKLAEVRLKQLKRRLEIDQKYKEDFVTFMEKMLKNGQAEKAPKQYERAWYIPHHGVYHPRKPEKLRVVFDCSAEFQGHSLNRHLLQGPDLTNSLTGVLCHFRQEPVAFACDIEGMFHQVHINEEHHDPLHFLWWDIGDTTKEPYEYRMTVHMFGATLSPGCANLALRTAADDGKDDLGVEAPSFIKENFYVDDGLKPVPTVPEAIKLINNGTEMCMRGGFRLHKFTSNSKVCLRYQRILLDQVCGKQMTTGGFKTTCAARKYNSVSVGELHAAAQEIIRHVQNEAFKEEISKLKNPITKGKAKGSSPLSHLDPFLDPNNLVRIGGHIRQASVSQDIKHLFVLPGQGHTSKILANHYHEKALHQGKGITLNEIRSSGFWIIGGGTMVSRPIHQCVTCRRLRAKVQQQKMADLPADRLTPTPPFTYCGVDYFGPWYVKEGHKELKRYGVLFTCLVTRAIHLEVANSLETDSYINTLRCFICTRGPVRQMRSNNGSNFIGARRELKEALAEMHQDQVKTEMLKENCDWLEVKFNIQSASHMGGIWERQIRSDRSVLSALLESNGKQMNDEALRTFMYKAEAVVNSRTLTAEGIA